MGRSVFILDDDDDLRDTLAEVLEARCRAEVMTLPDVESMIRSADHVLACSLAILDINLGHGRPTGLDAQAWLTERGFAGRIVLLTGHAATNPLVRQANEIGGTTILSKPIETSKLCALLAKEGP